MQLGQAQVVRSNWYDRTPLPIWMQYHNARPPHALATRVTYTVPVGRKFNLGTLAISMNRHTVAAPVDVASIYANVNIEGGGLGQGLEIESYLNTVGPIGINKSIGGIILGAGSVISVDTSDFSTGGLVYYSIVIIGTEYDA